MPTHELVRRELMPAYPEFLRCNSTAELEQLSLYQSLKPHVDTVLNTAETGDYRLIEAPAKERYRIVAWNIERGNEFTGQLEVFRHHPYIKDADILLLTEADIGMVRSGNRNVVKEFARELGMTYAFVPCYLSLVKGSGVEYFTEGENDLGLHGNAILSRYPMTHLHPIRLKNGRDKMRGREKRLGTQAVLAADIALPNLPLTAVSVHLDAQSTQKHRAAQMRQILDKIAPGGPAILGGDWNTSTYDSSHAFYAICGFWLRVLMGVDHVIRNHYLHPEKHFERELFQLLEARAFDFRNSKSWANVPPGTTWTRPDRIKTCVSGCPIGASRSYTGPCAITITSVPLKLDWFAARELACRNPIVIHDVREKRPEPLSDHDAIGVDVIAR